MNGWILFAHGSSDPDWSQPMRRIAARIADRRGDQAVALAFLERQRPSLEDAAGMLIQNGASTITVVPMFLGMGGHLKNDLPVLIDALRLRWAAIDFRLTAPVGEADLVVGAIVDHVSGLAPS